MEKPSRRNLFDDDSDEEQQAYKPVDQENQEVEQSHVEQPHVEQPQVNELAKVVEDEDDYVPIQQQVVQPPIKNETNEDELEFQPISSSEPQPSQSNETQPDEPQSDPVIRMPSRAQSIAFAPVAPTEAELRLKQEAEIAKK